MGEAARRKKFIAEHAQEIAEGKIIVSPKNPTKSSFKIRKPEPKCEEDTSIRPPIVLPCITPIYLSIKGIHYPIKQPGNRKEHKNIVEVSEDGIT